MLGLRRLKLDAIWLELLPATDDPQADQARIKNFQQQLRTHGLAGRFCFLYKNPEASKQELDVGGFIEIYKQPLPRRGAAQTPFLILSFSIPPPLLLQFE